MVVYALLPVLWILSLSLKPTSMVKDGRLIPSSVTLENYRGIFRGEFFSSALINSVGIGLTTTVIAVALGAMAAYAIARLDFPGKRLLIGATLLVTMFPAISLVTPLFNIERFLGLFDTWPGLIIALHHVRVAPCHLHVVGVLPRDPLGSWRRPPRWTAPRPRRRSAR